MAASGELKQMALTVRFWGTRGGIPTPGPETIRYGGNTPCVEVRVGDTNIIFDAGTGVRGLGLDILEREGPFVGHLFIGHCHWDHIQGFPFFAPAYVPGNQLTVYGSQGSGRGIREVLEGQMAHDFFPVEIKEMGADVQFIDLEQGSFDIDDCTITTLHLNHPGLSMAVRVDHDGRSVAYSSDSEPFREILGRQNFPSDSPMAAYIDELDERVVEFARGADLLIMDGQYTADEYPAKLGWGHASMNDAAEVGRRAEVKRVAVYHHDPLHDDDYLDTQRDRLQAMLTEAGSSTEVVFAAEGLELEL